MAKKTTRFYCTGCGHEELRWLGKCPGCGEWNTFAEAKVAAKTTHKGARGFSTAGRGKPVAGSVGQARPVPLSKVSSAETNRLPVEPAEVARVLGGGLVEGSVVLLGGEPGVGKSTLLTGLALWWVRRGIKVIYVAGEESPAQIRMRAERLGFNPDKEEGFHILQEVQLERLVEALVEDAPSGPEDPPTVIIADSVQTLQRAHRFLSRQPHSDPLLRRGAGRLRPAFGTSGLPGGPRDQER